MGASQSSVSAKERAAASKFLEEPIQRPKREEEQSPFPIPTGQEFDAIDRIAAELPNVIDDESRQQVEDYKQACDNGNGPVVACFATDGTMAYPAGCFNLAKMLMTGKGGILFDRAEAYQLFDRACRGGHGGACFLQAQILCTRPETLGKGVPHDPQKAMDLYQSNCEDLGDSISCYTLAVMLLRGDRVHKFADNVSPQEARGEVPLVQRENEENRARREDEPYLIARDPPRARELLEKACLTSSHVTSCHNLAVMYTQGDDGVPPDEEKAAYFKKKTQEQVNIFGGF